MKKIILSMLFLIFMSSAFAGSCPMMAKNIDAKIEIFNPNGDRAEACGNGTRCVAKILFEEEKYEGRKYE